MSVSSDQPLTTLRAERRRLSEQVARLSWLRRLVGARSDLEVARLSGVPGPDDGLEPLVRLALTCEGARGPELLQALSVSARRLDEESRRTQTELDALTGELVERLAQNPRTCLSR